MKRLGIVIIIMQVVAPALAGVVEDSGIKGGIIVQVGCKDGKSLANLLVNDRFLVHGLDVDANLIAEVRDYLLSEHLYGKVSAAMYDGKNLPYTDNLINLLVIEDSKCRIREEEMMRVIVPGGVVMVRGEKITKSVPSNIDEWTHFLHGADNNAVANDTVVAAPRTIQWVSNPKWARSHEEAASVSAVVSATGRVFAIIDEAPNISIRFMADWKLVARDAFNGTLLWKKNVPTWSDHLRHFRAGPTHLTRRLVAVGDKVYVTLDLDAPVSVLDAATGDVIKVLQGTERTEEIAVDGGIIYLVVGTSEVHRRGGGLYYRGEPRATDFRYIMAVDGDSGEHLWKKDFIGTDFLLPMTMTVRKGSVFYQDINGVGRLDARTGREIWEKKRRTVARRMSFASPTVVATDDVLLVADRIPKVDSQNPQQTAATDKVVWGVHGWNQEGFARRCPNLLVAYSVQNGDVLWSKPCSENYNSAVDIFVVEDKVYVSTGWDRFDLKTGEKEDGRQVKMTGGKVGMAHHRCYRNKASVRYVFTGRSGIEVADLEKGWLGNNSWIRGACQYGIMPANGLLYAPPDACGCFNKVKVQGFFAVGPARENKGVELSDTERLMKGPSYGKVSGLQTSNNEDWPMYRHDGQRSGGSRTTVSAELKKSWSTKLTGRLTQPAIVGETVYIAETDSHTVYALSTADGIEKWRFTVDGRIDSTPTIYKGMVIFGSADGCIYALRVKDGVLAWKFRAAPEVRLISSYGQLESAWPIHGSVLVQNDVIYTSAGRNTYLDNGITFFKMDPMTGKVLNKNVLYNFDPETGAQLGPEARFDMDGVNTDILSGDGENIFMKQERLDGSLQKGAKDAPHLFGVHGFLGEEWFVRSYWLLGTNVRAGWGAWASGNETTFGRIIAFNDENAYGYGRVRIASAATGHKADDYHLYGVRKVLMTTGLPKTRRKRGQKDPQPTVRRPLKPDPFWADEHSLIVRAMVLTKDKLIVAGPPDLRRKESGILAYSNEEDSLASIKGKKGVMLQVVDIADGRTVSEQNLDAMPVFDGMSAAHGRVFVSLKNGEVQCWK